MKEPSPTGILTLNLLLSARVAKFFKLKPPELVKLGDWGNWTDSTHHWFSNWRCEDSMGIIGSKERIFVITNETSPYSILVNVGPENFSELILRLHHLMMQALDDLDIYRPGQIQLQLTTLSASANSLA